MLIKVWCRTLLAFLIPIILFGVGIPLYALFKIEARSNSELDMFGVLKENYERNPEYLNFLWLFIPTLICIFLGVWAKNKLKNRDHI